MHKKVHEDIHVSNIHNICTYCALISQQTYLSHSLGSRDSLPPPPPNTVLLTNTRLTTGWVRAGCLTHIPNKTSQDPDLRFCVPIMAQGAKAEFWVQTNDGLKVLP